MTDRDDLPRALLVTLHAYPDPAVGAKRISELANFLGREGWIVKLAAGAGPFSVDGGHLAQTVERVSIPLPAKIYPLLRPLVPRRLRTTGGAGKEAPISPADRSSHRTGVIARLRDYFFSVVTVVDSYKLWSWKMYRRLAKVTKDWRPDVVLVSAPPWSPVLAAAALANRRRIPLVIDFRDPWLKQGNALSPAHQSLNSAVVRKLERWVVSGAAMVVCTSNRLRDEMLRRYEQLDGRIVVIRNGFDAAERIDQEPPRDGLRLLFAGTIYLNRNPMPLLEAILLLLQRPGVDRHCVHATFVGHCSHWNGLDLQEWVRANGLDDRVRIMPPTDPASVRTLAAASNVLVNFAQGQKTQVPAKLFEQIGARRPVLLFEEPDSESAECAAELPSVVRVDDDPDAVADVLDRWYREFRGSRSPSMAIQSDLEKFSRQASNLRLLEILNRLRSISAAAGASGVRTGRP